MIKVDDKGVILEGTTLNLALDVSQIVRAFHELLEEKYDNELADDVVDIAGRIAMTVTGDMDSTAMKEAAQHYSDELDKILLEYTKRVLIK